jgi:LacI family transcriptional regulator
LVQGLNKASKEMTQEKKITIKDIAQIAGVSIGTVDRVIHNRGEVSLKTKEKILKITNTLNFQPDVIASMLASKKIVRFALLMPAADRESTFWKMPIIGIEKAIKEIEHYGVVYSKYQFSLSNKNTFLEEGRSALNDNPDGILIAPSFKKEATEIAKICDEKKVPYVFLNSTIADQNQICFVGQDALQSGFVSAKLMDYGLAEGSEILVVSILSFLKNNNHLLDRKQGFLQYFENKKERNIKLISLEIDSLNLGDVYEALRNAFSQNPSIKGVFVTNSRVFLVARFIESQKMENIKLIGYDLTVENIPFLEKEIINFLINQKPVEQAYRALTVLFNKVVLKKDIPKEILLPIDIVTKENLKYYEEY